MTTDKPQPPAKPEKPPEPKQKTKAGAEIPIPKRGEFFDALGKASKPAG